MHQSDKSAAQSDPELGPILRDAQSKGPSGAMQLMNNRPLMERLQVRPAIAHCGHVVHLATEALQGWRCTRLPRCSALHVVKIFECPLAAE